LIIGFQDTVENVGDVFLGHSVQNTLNYTTHKISWFYICTSIVTSLPYTLATVMKLTNNKYRY